MTLHPSHHARTMPRGRRNSVRSRSVRGTDSSQTHRWREVDSNFQYAGTGESRHPSFVLPNCLGRVGACPVLRGSYDLIREEIWVNLID